MDLFVLDDSAQRNPTRDGMGPLVAVGGLYVPGGNVRSVERSLDDLCTEFGFPDGEEFKWSPHRKSWMQKALCGDDREAFFARAFAIAEKFDLKALVVIEDIHRRPAASGSKSAEEDVVTLFLERADNQPVHNAWCWLIDPVGIGPLSTSS